MTLLDRSHGSLQLYASLLHSASKLNIDLCKTPVHDKAKLCYSWMCYIVMHIVSGYKTSCVGI